MKRMVSLGIAGLGVLGFMSGCKTFGPTDKQAEAMTQAYNMFASQQRMGEVIKVEGTEAQPAKVEITGKNITVATPLPPLQALQPYGDRQYDTMEHIATELSRLGMFGAAAYLLKDSIGHGDTNTTNNYNGGVTP